MLITLGLLKKLGACDEAVLEFKKQFPTARVSVEKLLSWLRKINQPTWEAWMMAHRVKLSEAFLKAGADVHAQDDYALRWAAELGHTRVVGLLLKAGADVHALGDYALCWAAQLGHTQTVELLKKYM